MQVKNHNYLIHKLNNLISKTLLLTTGALLGGLLVYGVMHRALYTKLEEGDLAFTNRHNAIYKIDINHTEAGNNPEYSDTQQYDEFGNLIASVIR